MRIWIILVIFSDPSVILKIAHFIPTRPTVSLLRLLKHKEFMGAYKMRQMMVWGCLTLLPTYTLVTDIGWWLRL